MWKNIRRSYNLTKVKSFILHHFALALCIIIVILVWYIIMALSYNPYEMRLTSRRTMVRIGRKEIDKRQSGLQTPLQPFSYYSNIFKSRGLFGVHEDVEKSDMDSPKSKIPLITIQELVSKFSLMGLVSVNGRYEAVIQNKQTGQIRYLREGDTIEELTVKRITSGRVIFQYENKEIELGL